MSTKAETEQQPAAPSLSAADTEPGTAESGGSDGLSSTAPPEAGGQESNRAVPENTQPKSEGSQNTTGKEHPPPTRVTTSDFNDSDGMAPPGYPLLIGTWNVQKMDGEKLERVKKEMERINIDILGVSELEWTGAGQFQSGSYMIYYSGYSTLKKSGVGFIVKKNVSKSLMRYKAVTDRLILIRIQGKPVNTTIIHVCAPATNVEDEEIDDFYKLLQSEIDQVSKKDALVITGDWNARVGNKEDPPVTGRYGLDERNEAGERMIEFCKTNDLYIGNTFYKRHKRRLYTYASPDGQYREQVAYLCGKRRWRCLMSSVKTRPGAICGTDHRLLMCRFGLMLKKSRPNPEGPKHGPDRIPPELTPSK